MVKNLKLGDLSITGLNDINRFSIPVKNLFPDFDDSILRKNDPLPESVMSKGLIPDNKILAITPIWKEYFD